MMTGLRVDALPYGMQAAGGVWVSVADDVLGSDDESQLDASMVVWVRRAAHQPGVGQPINHGGGGRRFAPPRTSRRGRALRHVRDVANFLASESVACGRRLGVVFQSGCGVSGQLVQWDGELGWGGGWVLEGEADVGRLVAVFDPSSHAERADAGMLLVWWWGEDVPALEVDHVGGGGRGDEASCARGGTVGRVSRR